MTAGGGAGGPEGAPAGGDGPAPPGGWRWWHDAVGYEVYVPSFADSTGDGMGDLPGVTAHLGYLAWLGVDVVWLTPFYPSPLRDHGYDVVDYTGVDPRFGTWEDLDALLARARELGLRVVVDLVPNHTSSDHPWFRRARSARDDPYRDYYVWRDPAPDGGPPNNWVSHFGGPAWTFDEATGQYWLHLFLPEQPDLNWRNPAVALEFDRILRFWLDRGVAGFRIDVAHALLKHPDFPDLPEVDGHLDGPVETREHERLDHVHDVDQPEVLDTYRRWRQVVEPYDALLVGEVYLLEAERLARYVDRQDGLHQTFWFKPLHLGWDPAALREALMAATSVAPPGTIAFVQGSHDRSRAVSRFGGGGTGRARALALQTLLAFLPGTPYVYQGEEVGLPDVDVPPEAVEDPIAARGRDYEHGRDRCRSPMPWEPGPTWGFTSAARPWLPPAARTAADTVAAQRADPESTLARYRALFALRRARAELRRGECVWLEAPGDVLAYRRGRLLVAANCGASPTGLPLPEDGRWEVVFASARAREGERAAGTLELAPAEAAVLAPA